MRRRERVAVSIPRELLAEIESMRQRSGESRSAVFERALSAYVASADAARSARRYLAGYRRRPETRPEQRAALATMLEALAAQAWDA